MTDERARLLAELVEEMGRDNPKWFLPKEAWDAIQDNFPLPYIEMAVVRKNSTGLAEILLTYREDKDWKGWHIPGSLMRKGHTLEQNLTNMAKKEIGAEVGVVFLARGIWDIWLDHPYGWPISLVAICLGQNIVETEAMRWHSSVPKKMISDNGHHARFIESVFRQIKEQNLL